MPQTSYTIDHAAAVAGQVVNGDLYRGRYEVSETLSFGRLCELHTDGKLRAPQGTTLGKVIGGIPYNASLPPALVGGVYVNGWTSNDMPRVLRRGQMWVEYQGTAPAVEAKPNVMHSSTIATHRGKVTADATSAVAGSEITAAPEGIHVIKVDTTLGLALVEFNLPA